MYAQPLEPGPLQARASRPGIDPMLVWADATRLALMRRPGQPWPASWPLVLDDAAPGKSRHRTADWSEADLVRWLAHPSEAPRRLCLGMPVLPLRPRPRGLRPIERLVDWPAAQGELLLGVIDHGCPFAHALLRRGAQGTRVLALWDQDSSDAGIAYHAAGTPRQPGYGTLLTRSHLEAVMADHKVAGLGVVDESRCYEAVRYEAMRHGFTHGSSVLGVLVDGPPPGSRAVVADAVQTADVVFVQIPRDSVQDCSSAALEHYVLDGLDAILACRGEQTRHIVVTVSDGTSRTTHDGRSLVESGIAERVAALHEAGVTLQVIVAAGNSRDELRHAQFDPMVAGSEASVTLEVQPDDEAPTFVTLRLPARGLGLTVSLTAPDGSVVAARVGEAHALAAQPGAAAAATLILAAPAADALPDEAALGLVALHPTRRLDATLPTAPAGRWRIGVVTEQDTREAVHLWISRSQTNATALPRGRQARFCDEDGRYDPGRARLALEADPTPPGSPIRRLGCINGLATLPCHQGMVVVGAAFDRENVPTLHSASGPSAGQGKQARIAPDFVVPVDHTRTDPGLTAPGTRSGVRVRVSGSSFAAPQAAAVLAQVSPTTAPPPSPRSGRSPPIDPVMGAGVIRRR